MRDRKKSPVEFTIEELDRELIARGAQIPGEKRFKFKDKEGTPARDAVMANAKEIYDRPSSPGEDFAHIPTLDIGKTIKVRTSRSFNMVRGSWDNDLLEYYEINDEKIKNNAAAIAVLCMKDDLENTNKEYSLLKVKNYGKTFNLCHIEPFYDQPVIAGSICTGFLVKEDIIATAGHFVNEGNIADLRVVFGFRMPDSSAPAIQLPVENIYKGVKIISRVCDPAEGDWALVQLERQVTGQAVVKLEKDGVEEDQEIYVIGHPLGLPLKYSGGSYVMDNSHNSYFSADLDVYSSCSGAPVFASNSGEVIGIVSRESCRDFRFVNKCWMTVNTSESEGVRCSRLLQLIDIVAQL